MATELKLPELGENIETGDVVRVLVSEGDTIAKDQPIVELETDKATIEVPAEMAGRVESVRVKAGQKISVGQVILTVVAGEAAGDAPRAAPPAAPARAPDRSAQAAAASAPAAEEPGAGDSPREPSPETSDLEPGPARRGEVVDISRGARAQADSEPPRRAAPAAPSVRRLARELGLEIDRVSGTGPGGRISADDVLAHAKSLIARSGRAPAGAPARPLPDFARWGDVERQPMRAVRRKTAQHLGQAWAAIPHVTQFDRADVTTLEELRRRFGPKVERAGGKLTVTAIALKVVASALRVFPQFNASIDPENEEIVYKKYVHIGVAVDTDRGLLVPVIRDVDRKNIVELAVDLAGAASRAGEKKTSLEEMEGGTFTISNLGGLGGTAFTPIVNWPEVAILGLSRATTEPVYVGGELVPRTLLPLSLSYDHRLIDGADAVRFLRWVAEALEQPFLVSLEG